MNSDVLEGKWEQAKGEIRQKWSKLTDSDIEDIKGKTQELLGRLQERYGYSREEAQSQVDELKQTL